MDGRLIFIDDQSSGVPTTALLQSLQTDDSTIASGKLLLIVKSVIANPEIATMISEGIKRINELCLRFLFRLKSLCLIFSLVMAFSRFASSVKRSLGKLLEHEMVSSTPCRSSTVTPEFSLCLQIMSGIESS